MSERLTILTGDWIEQLRTLPNQSVHCCVTSPPYWGLRDYGTSKWEGGDPLHEHDRIPARNGRGGSGSPGKQTADAFPSTIPTDICSCGAIRVDKQLGLEKTPEEYVEKIVAGFREVWRVLRDDATCWINLGDCYATGGGRVGTAPGEGKQGEAWRIRGLMTTPNRMPLPGLKPKDLVGIPWRVAFALQADGWYLRSDIIWHKPNPMPESVTDRPTKSHEYIFLLSKNERYFYDAETIKEQASTGTHETRPKAWDVDMGSHRTLVAGYKRKLASNGSGIKNNSSFDKAMAVMPETRNKRTVWTVTTSAYPEAHFATFPPDLIKPCILAGCPVGGTVLDPFFGSGTTGQVALELGRSCTGIELNPKYVELAQRRCSVTPGLQLA